MRNYENERELTRALLDFLEKSPTSFHAVEQMEARLRKEGFEELREEDSWKLEEGGKYYVIRSMSSLIAFRIPGTDFGGYQIMASHSDSPAFKLKENPEMEAEQHYVKLNVEKYGGMLCAPWFDRPLSIAGTPGHRQRGQTGHKAGERGPGFGDDSQPGNPYEPPGK